MLCANFQRMLTQSTPCHVAPLADEFTAYFDCFNAGRYFEAHEALERLWLETRHDADGNFYKGLIQLAAAFVHWEAGRTGPAATLLRMADDYLAKYPARHHGLDVANLQRAAAEWVVALMKAAASGQPLPCARPQLHRDPM